MSLVTGSQTWLIILTAISALLKAAPALIKLITQEQERQNLVLAIGAAFNAIKENL